MTKTKFLTADDIRRLVSGAKHDPRNLRCLIIQSLAGQRLNATLQPPWLLGGASKSRRGPRHRRDRDGL
jgi:hypothetical protein